MTSFWTKSVLLFSCIPDVNLGMIKINLFSVRGTKSPRGLRGPAFIELLLCVRHFWASYQPCDVGDTISLSSMRWKNCSCSQKLTNKREVKLCDPWLGLFFLSCLLGWLMGSVLTARHSLSLKRENYCCNFYPWRKKTKQVSISESRASHGFFPLGTKSLQIPFS